MRASVAALVDAAAVAVFAAVGRASHDESIGPVGVAETAWPFWAGAVVGWAVSRAWRRPVAVTTGVAVGVGAWVGGMIIRALTGAGVAPAFMIVAGISLAILLLGWRGVAAAVARSRRVATS